MRQTASGWLQRPQIPAKLDAGCDRACNPLIRGCLPISALKVSNRSGTVFKSLMASLYGGLDFCLSGGRRTSLSTTFIESLQPALTTASYRNPRCPITSPITFCSLSSCCHPHNDCSSTPSRRIQTSQSARSTSCEQLSKTWRTVVGMGAEPRLTAASAPTALRTSPRSSARGWPRRACPRPPRLWALLPMSSRVIVHWGQTALQVGTRNRSFWLNLSFLVFETVGAIDTKLIPKEQWQ